jgi:predicted Fe-Mo cluster-binding NifX family protein
MKVAIPSKGEGISADVERQFGRCSNFLFVDTETLECRTVPNEAKDQAGGAGVAAAQQVVDEGAEAVLAGVIGPNASDVLSEAHVSIYEDVSGPVVEALELLESGDLERSPEVPGPSLEPSEQDPEGPDLSSDTAGPGLGSIDPVHLGARRESGWGRGRGGGGRGRGRGGRGRGRGGRARRNRRVRARQRDYYFEG